MFLGYVLTQGRGGVTRQAGVWSYPQGVCPRGCEGKHREDLQRGHQGCSLFAAGEGQEGGGQNGAILVGDERSGRFSHELVKGEYRMVGQTVVVTITEKHWLLTWTVVEAQLRELVL